MEKVYQGVVQHSFEASNNSEKCETVSALLSEFLPQLKAVING